MKIPLYGMPLLLGVVLAVHLALNGKVGAIVMISGVVLATRAD